MLPTKDMKAFCIFIFMVIFWKYSEGYRRHIPEWTADVPGGPEEALRIASRHGMRLRSHISIGQRHKSLYRFIAKEFSEENAQRISKRLKNDPKVRWFSRQGSLDRERKYLIRGLSSQSSRGSNEKILSRQKRHHLDVNCVCKNVSNFPDESFGEHVYNVLHRQSDPSLAHMFDDPKWPCQWELYNCGQTSGPHRVDLNVVPCWEKGFTGKGVVVSIVDDGLDYNNRDLKHAYDKRASTDLNENFDGDGPLPNKANYGNDHGTKCGGEIAMQPNNKYCGVGVAYDATIGGIRFLDGIVTDTNEAAALVFNADYIDIYSCSWGPQDNGRTWEGPGNLASSALEVGSSEGRGGLGSIYVWASGNGGAAGDHCGADGYTCSIYTIGIASVSAEGLSTFYTEPCPCIMAVTLNGGTHKIPKSMQNYEPWHYLVTTDPYAGCVNTFSGTSSAAPLASGIVALMLQANPTLTWRDVQHIIARNSKIPNPTEVGWNINGAGLHVHHKYGFGLMDAAKLVMSAQTWKTVDEQRRCQVRFPNGNKYVRAGGSATFNGSTTACSGSVNQVQELEHVQVIMSYYVKCRGDVSIELTSPCGTKSELMGVRPLDNSQSPIKHWAFMTVHNWGEDPRGAWAIQVKDNKGSVKTCNRPEKEFQGVFVQDVSLVFWGTSGQQGKKPGCVQKEQIAEELMEQIDDNNDEKPLDINPKAPIDIQERLNQEIIDIEFMGEQDNDVTANDLKSPQKGKVPKRIADDEPEPSEIDADDAYRRFLSYIEQSSDSDLKEEEYKKNNVPLRRTARKGGGV